MNAGAHTASFGDADRPECTRHAAKCLARLIDVVLGEGAASKKKLKWGASLCIFGIEFKFAEHGFREFKLNSQNAEARASF